MKQLRRPLSLSYRSAYCSHHFLIILFEILYDDKIVIKLNNPTKRSPDDSDNTNSQGFCFTQLSIKLQGVKMQMLMYVF